MLWQGEHLIMSGEMRENFGVGANVMGVMPPWLLSISLDSCIREMKAKAGDLHGGLNGRSMEQSMVAGF